MLRRLKDISELPEQDREAILYNIDALLRDAKTRLAYNRIGGTGLIPAPTFHTTPHTVRYRAVP